MGYEIFFPNDKESPSEPTPSKAKRVCSAPCPVRKTCLKYALENDCSYGVWGGTTRGQRKQIQNYIKEHDMTVDEYLEGMQ